MFLCVRFRRMITPQLNLVRLRSQFLANVNVHVHVRYMLSPVRLSVVCLSSVCRLSVTLVHPTQAVQLFGNISTAFGTLAIH